jgi:glycosyltransferase involved in cell wall biosynthesis
VAVDNASTDASAQILRSYEHRLPLTVLHESRRGKNHAMNRGVEAVNADLLLCIDDDVVLDRGWLLAIKRTFDSHPEIDIVCGPVEPLWPGPVPRYTLPLILRHGLAACLATLRGDPPTQYRGLWECGYACGLAVEGWRESRGVKP